MGMKEYIVLVDESTLEQDELEWFKEQGAKKLIRCKDCKHGGIDSTSHPNYWCSAHSEYHEPDWFCADGERKEDKLTI